MLLLDRQVSGPPRLLSTLTVILCLAIFPSHLEAKEGSHSFAIPAAAAEVTLETFSEQADVQIVYLISDVQGVTTHSVNGVLANREALERMIADTGLEVKQEGKTGAFVVGRSHQARPAAEKLQNASVIPSKTMKLSLRARLAAALATLTSSSLSAQTASTTPIQSEAENDTAIVLSPFEVRTDKDRGYTAASALAGGRTDSPLKLTSAAISVMTSEFLEDIGSTNFLGAAEWAVNWVPFPETNTAYNAGFSVNYRNMGSSYASRNYFLWYVESDSYNTERYEFARGPNAVLFGDAGAGGISTTWTKRPRFDRALYSVNTRADTYGGYRSSIDFNQPITKNFALRLNSYYDSSPSWRDYTDNSRNGTHLAGRVLLPANSEFRFEGEFGTQRRIVYPNYYVDQGSYWNRTLSYNGVTAPTAAVAQAAGISRVSGSNYFVYVPGTPNGGLNDWGTFYQSLGTGVGLLPTGAARTDIPNSPTLPNKEFNFQPPDSLARLLYYTYSLYFDHRINDNLFVEVAYNRLHNDRHSYGQNLFNMYRIDVNTTLPGGAANPNYGKPYTDAERIHSLQENTVGDLRALVNWRFDTSWLKQSFSFIGGSRRDVFDAYSRTLRRIDSNNPNINSPANIFRDRRYWDQAGLPLDNIPNIPGVTLAYVPTTVTHQRKILDYLQLASTSRFLDDRLAVTFGLRRDALSNSQRATSGIPVDPVTGLPQLGAVVTPEGSTKPVAIVGGKYVNTFAPISRNIGAVYFVRSWIGVFANYSETFSAPNSGDNLIDGRAPGISRSKGEDFGFKLELLDGKIAGSISYYTSQQNDLLITGANAADINTIWSNLNRPDLASVSFRDTQAIKGDGVELDLTANPTRSLRLMLNLALPRTSAIDLEPGLFGYFNANIKTWQDALTNGTTNNSTAVSTSIDNIRNHLASLTPGTPLNNTYKYTGNIYATYTFMNGMLKDLSIGAGANARGKAKIASSLTNAYDYLYADDYILLSAHATYRLRICKKVSARLQINVTNLLDNDKGIYNTFTTYRAGGIPANPLIQVPGTIRIPDPRKFTFQTTFDF